jgi:transcriptional regulator GlxA family with amidase domain
MNARKNGARNGAAAPTVYRLPGGAELVLAEAETTVLVVRGSCAVRTAAGKLERVPAGAVLVRQRETNKNTDRRIAKAIGLLHAEPAKRWTVERLARAVGLSRAAFARRFVAQHGRSPVRYLTELRLALAASLLEHDEASLAEVALRVGYASEFAFGRAFKRQHGVAPGLFRRLRAPFTPTLMAA